MRWKLLLVALACAPLWAQNTGAGGGSAVVSRQSDPTGSSCTTTSPLLVYSSNLYNCQGGTYAPFAAGGGGSGQPAFSQSFTSQTSIVLHHSFNTFNVLTDCYDATNNEISPAQITVTDANDVTVKFLSAQTGRCVVNGSVGPSGSATVPHSFGATFAAGGSVLSPGAVTYFTVPYSCAINSYSANIDQGTATFDVWKVASGTANPSAGNSIVGGTYPGVSTGTASHSTNVSSWTTAVLANDIVAVQLKTITGNITQAAIQVVCQ